jgi:hypothetical protein
MLGRQGLGVLPGTKVGSPSGHRRPGIGVNLDELWAEAGRDGG